MIVEDLSIFTEDDAQAARACGFTFVCSMCVKLHAGRRRENASWEKARCVGRNCTGPIGGGSYPEYEGPLKETSAFGNHCWACGKESPESFISSNRPGHDSGRLIGCCTEHLKLIRENDFDCRPAGTNAKRKVRIAGHVVDW